MRWQAKARRLANEEGREPSLEVAGVGASPAHAAEGVCLATRRSSACSCSYSSAA